ncbi:MAG TPA: hypothetical protein VM934_10795 [Pyrinomonadaceae bacterium]|jgi:hypothetical protein|nr:hypothetical protein [Pyrinomonadaceae bacterium]
MPDVGGVGGTPVAPQNQNRVGEQGVPPVNQSSAQVGGASGQPVGQPGPLGQPTGLPVPGVPGQGAILPDVLAGRDASQLAAAEQMRARGGASATDELLGLNRQPTMIGALTPPPGNNEALRHMTPTMRRTVMRNLLDKQRERMRGLAHLLRRERDGGDGSGDERGESSSQEEEGGTSAAENLLALAVLDETQIARARGELGNTARMLDLLDELLAMQDYAVSQMGTFSQG